MTESDIITSLKSTSSSNAKKDILRSVLADRLSDTTERFITGMMMAYDPFTTFGVKKIPLANHGNDTSDGFYDKFYDVAYQLQTRELTGNAALDAVADLADSSSADLWNGFYRKVLLKNMDCGVNITTWNNVAKEYGDTLVVQKFTCQLATSKDLSKLSGQHLVQVKYDGVRCLTVVDPSGKVEMFSRNGRLFTNFTTIADELSKFGKHLNEPMVFDGEVMSGSFQDLMKQVHRKQNVQTDDAVFHVYDLIPKSDFLNGLCDMNQENRTANLRDYINLGAKAGILDHVEFVEGTTLDLSTQEGIYKVQVLNDHALLNGYEGLILKDLNAPYKNGRGDSWVKVKPTIEVTLQVKDVVIGTGKYSSTTGALTCEGTETGKFISVSVGSGLSDEMRDQIWSEKESVIGQLVEVTADAITQNQDGSYSLRFPRFKTFRGFDVGEKI